MTATTTTKQQEILDLETHYWDAIKTRDARALGRLTADEFTFVMGEGVSKFSRDEFVDMMTNSDFRLKSYKFDDGSVSFRELSPGSAFIAYKVHEAFERGGKPDTVDSYVSSNWVKSGTGWQCAAVTEARIPTKK